MLFCRQTEAGQLVYVLLVLLPPDTCHPVTRRHIGLCLVAETLARNRPVSRVSFIGHSLGSIILFDLLRQPQVEIIDDVGTKPHTCLTRAYARRQALEQLLGDDHEMVRKAAVVITLCAAAHKLVCDLP